MSINNWVLSYQAWKENRSITGTQKFLRADGWVYMYLIQDITFY